ncbi:hypothetical protein HZ326_22673 [Fusarium oxysporum f. sp. albedinis]|nr:hypothetical protein HZ326_22673 [Fusarium oxysporum f. sp. albedinis]
MRSRDGYCLERWPKLDPTLRLANYLVSFLNHLVSLFDHLISLFYHLVKSFQKLVVYIGYGEETAREVMAIQDHCNALLAPVAWGKRR